jgi:hypothetical protein
MSDEELYLEATCEVEGDDKNLALWAKVMALSEGDQEKAKYQYIKLRVEQLARSKKENSPVFTKKTVDQFALKYMPISEFSRIKSIPEKKILEMIRNGFYVGQIKGNEWFVSRDEVEKEEPKIPIYFQIPEKLAAWYNSKTKRQVNVIRITALVLSAVPVFGWLFVAPWMIPLMLYLEFHLNPNNND